MNERSKYKLKGFGFMFLSSSLMGGIGAFARYINAPGDFIAFWRSFAGFLGMTIIFLVIGGFRKVRATRFSPSILFSGIFLGLLSALYVIATQYTTLANASFLIYTGPIYSTVLATIFLKEPFKPAMLASLTSVAIGTLLIVEIVSEEGFRLDLDPQYMTGNIIALASGVAYGLYLFVSRYREDCDSNVRAWYNFLFAASTIAVMVAFRWSSFVYPVRESINGVPTTTVDADGRPVSAPWSLLEMDGRSWAVLLVAALVTGFGAFYFLTVASKILLAGELATISYQETIMASILGFILFHEHLSGLQFLGGALIIAGGLSQILFSTRGAATSPITEAETAPAEHEKAPIS
ncbi:MAG: DMT family transporter [Actinomyces ruminicola]|uniref:EamA domain-containing membrane protein RarD n=1 Tax=Actinomyces ruminicola TaxID=332524 RepID=A0A1G9V9S0_9ACTO|nr:DMT family transporter [Actinomyces ruminicola]MBE6481539.1 DMT family transporter [Actinomyces ruminicola]SDM68635.1 EamA domain-containing membrane protein RarD [Actinomyces ruminicola]